MCIACDNGERDARFEGKFARCENDDCDWIAIGGCSNARGREFDKHAQVCEHQEN